MKIKLNKKTLVFSALFLVIVAGFVLVVVFSGALSKKE